MRILITTDVLGGVWPYTSSLVRGLADEGHACLVAILGEPSAAQLASLPAGVEHAARDLRLEWMPDADEDVAAAGDWLRELAGRWRPDVIHLNQFAYAAEPFDAPTVVVAHSDVRSWFGEVEGCAAPEEWDEYGQLVRRGLAAATSVVAPTAYQSGLLLRHYGRGADAVIHNGVAPPSVAPLPSASCRPGLMTAGRAWDAAKAVWVLDDALELLGDDPPLAQLAGALDGPSGESYAPVRIEPLGRMNRAAMDRLYAGTGLYVGTSVYEPFGLAPLEAALHGCVLVLSDIGSFRELWTGCAEFYSAGNPASLAGALRRVLDDPVAADELARSAHERARTRYTADRMRGRYLELYEDLSSGARGAAVARVRPRVAERPLRNRQAAWFASSAKRDTHALADPSDETAA